MAQKVALLEVGIITERVTEKALLQSGAQRRHHYSKGATEGALLLSGGTKDALIFLGM